MFTKIIFEQNILQSESQLDNLLDSCIGYFSVFCHHKSALELWREYNNKALFKTK